MPYCRRRLGRFFEEMAVRPKLRVPLSEPFGDGNLEQGLEIGQELLLERRGCRGRILMRAAQWLWNDFIRELELEQILGGDLKRFGGLAGGGAILPEDGGAAFRAD